MAFANKALMGDDYEGSGVDALQGLGSAVYAGAEQSKAKQLAGMEKSYNNQLESIYAPDRRTSTKPGYGKS